MKKRLKQSASYQHALCLKNSLKQVRKDRDVDYTELKQYDHPEGYLKAAFCRLMPKELLCEDGCWCCPCKCQQVQQTFRYSQPASLCKKFVKRVHDKPDAVNRCDIGPDRLEVYTKSKQEKEKCKEHKSD
jgi:hypothetical protein